MLLIEAKRLNPGINMKPLQIHLEQDKFYHIFNRGNNGDNMFYKPENYRFFLRRLDEYLSPYIEVFAFCLLPNHFHLLVRIKKLEFNSGTASRKALHLEDAKLLKTTDPVSQAFHRLFTSYSKAINKQEGRHAWYYRQFSTISLEQLQSNYFLQTFRIKEKRSTGVV